MTSRRRLKIRSLSSCQNHIPVIIQTLKAEFTEQGLELTDEKELVDYLLRGSYVMCDALDRNAVIGFFSLSRVDEYTSNNFVMQILSFILSFVFGRMFVYDFCILPNYRKKGNGVTMMQCLEHYCLNNYPLLRTLELHTQKDELTHFYNKCGFSLNNRVNNINVFVKKLI